MPMQLRRTVLLLLTLCLTLPVHASGLGGLFGGSAQTKFPPAEELCPGPAVFGLTNP